MKEEKFAIDIIMDEIEWYIYDTKYNDVREIINRYIEEQTPSFDLTMRQFQED